LTDIDIINYLGCCIVIASIFAGLLIASKDRSFRTYGVLFFFVCNICAINTYYLTGLFSSLFSVVVFVPINAINFYRTINNLK